MTWLTCAGATCQSWDSSVLWMQTPCGHNSCRKCFLRWLGQGKEQCPECRSRIPQRMLQLPRVNVALAAATKHLKIRGARQGCATASIRANSSGGGVGRGSTSESGSGSGSGSGYGSRSGAGAAEEGAADEHGPELEPREVRMLLRGGLPPLLNDPLCGAPFPPLVLPFREAWSSLRRSLHMDRGEGARQVHMLIQGSLWPQCMPCLLSQMKRF